MGDISRRRFISRTAGSMAGLRLMPADSSGPAVVSEDSADLLILGAGLAGLSAAITAADEGASVVLIDKRYKIGGTAMGAGGSYSAAGSRVQKAKNIQDSPELHFKDADRIGKGKADPEILKLYTENAAPVQSWLESLGVVFDPKGPRMAPEHELYSVPRTCDAVNGGRGYIAALGRQLQQCIDAGKVKLRTETTAQELIKRGGSIVGARVTGDDGKGSVISARSVILASGGYGSNQAMIRKYNPSLVNALKITSKYATGDGIRMAEGVGARLVDMDLCVPYFAGVENPPGSGRTLFISLISTIVPFFKGDVWVNKEGRRFMNEDSPSPDERERALRRVPEAAVFVIFDEARRKSNKPPLPDFDRLVQEGRVVKKAANMRALAKKIGVPAEALAKTVDRYNGYVDAGRDADFNRKDLVRIDSGPFYTIVAHGVIFMTMGGVKTDTRLQVIDSSGNVIPGLYAAGDVQGAGQWMGDGFVGGTGNCGAIVFGRLAAKSAVGYCRALDGSPTGTVLQFAPNRL